MEVIFIRHGETQHNKEHQLMGQRIDDALDKQGLHQASEALTNLPKDADLIFSSPMKRTLQTAEIVSRHLNLPVQISDLLKERDFGTLTGKTWLEIEEQTHHDLHGIDEKLQYDYRPFGGEAAAQVKARLLKFLDMLKAKHPNEKIIVVTHYGLIMLMNAIYPGSAQAGAGNVSIHTYVI